MRDEEKTMCPACVASAALMAGGVITTGGLTALAGKIFHTKKGAKKNGLDNTTQRRNDYGYGDKQDGDFEGRATS
jgi:hypothetical protein